MVFEPTTRWSSLLEESGQLSGDRFPFNRRVSPRLPKVCVLRSPKLPPPDPPVVDPLQEVFDQLCKPMACA